MTHHRLEPARRHERALHLYNEPADRLQWSGYDSEIGVERKQHADGELVVQDEVTAEPVHRDKLEHRHDIQERVITATHPHDLDGSGTHGVRLTTEPSLEDRLGAEAFDRANAAECLLDDAREIASLALQLTKNRPNPSRVSKRCVSDDRQASYGDQTEQRVDDDENDRHGDDGDGVRDPDRRRRHQRLNLEEITRDAREQLPSVHSIVVPDIEAQKAGEETAPEFCFDRARGNPVVIAPQA